MMPDRPNPNKDVRKVLQEQEDHYRLLIESIEDYAIFLLDTTGKVATWNKGAQKIKQYRPEEIKGRHFSTFYTQEAIDSDFPQFELTKALQDGRFEDEGWRLRKDGTPFWANVVITAIYDSTGRHIGFAKITRDLTEKRRNEELMKKNQELVRLNRDLDNFVYTASHDLKSPIANLEGLITELKQAIGAEQEKYADLLPWIDDNLHSLKKVVSDLAQVALVNQETKAPEVVDLAGLLAEIKDSLRDQILGKNVILSADFSAAPAIAYSPKNLRSIMFNLVSNAIKYSAAGKVPEIKITTRNLPDQKAVLLLVSDNGLGIPANQKDKIFSMFRRFHTHVEGSGVGLYLVKKILENQGDRIEVESQVNIGSTFKVFFYQR
jgi:PAS domain S-box-containing protein